MRKKIPLFSIYCGLLFITLLISVLMVDRFSECLDIRHMYNRCFYLLGSIQTDGSIFMWSSDNNGLGYGTSLFMNNIILLPLALLTYLGFNIFSKVYMLLSLVILYYGIFRLCRTYAKNIESSFFLISSLNAFLHMFIMASSYTVLIALGLMLYGVSELQYCRKSKCSLLEYAIIVYILAGFDIALSVIFLIILIVYIVAYKWNNRRMWLTLTITLINVLSRLVPLSFYGDMNLTSNVVLYNFSICNSQFADFMFIGADNLFNIVSIPLLVYVVVWMIFNMDLASVSDCALLLVLPWTIFITNSSLDLFNSAFMYVLVILWVMLLVLRLDAKWGNIASSFLVGILSIGTYILMLFNIESTPQQFITTELMQTADESLLLVDGVDDYITTVVDTSDRVYNYNIDGDIITINVGHSTDIRTLILPRLWYLGYECRAIKRGTDDMLNFGMYMYDNQQLAVSIPADFEGILSLRFNSSIYLIPNLVGLVILIVLAVFSIVSSRPDIDCWKLKGKKWKKCKF